jgi:hypothetical protein
MDHNILNLVDAIVDGKASQIENHFQSAMAERLSEVIFAKKENLAKEMFTNHNDR